MHKRALMVAAALVFGAWTIGAHAQETMGKADLQDFELDSGQELADLCSASEGDPLYVEATMFCYGVLEGIAQYHDAMARGPEGSRLVCPEEPVSRDEYVGMYVDWAKANPDMASSEPPADAVIRAALAEWGPCPE